MQYQIRLDVEIEVDGYEKLEKAVKKVIKILDKNTLGVLTDESLAIEALEDF